MKKRRIGRLMTVLLMMWIAWVAWRGNLPRGESMTLAQTARASLRGVGPLLAPVILIGGMVSGLFTPTEAAVVTVPYCLFLSAVVYREMPWGKLPQLMLETVEETGVLAFVLGAAAAMGWVLTTEGLPQMLSQLLLPIGDPLLVLLMLILMCCCWFSGV